MILSGRHQVSEASDLDELSCEYRQPEFELLREIAEDGLINTHHSSNLMPGA
jgi:hypothetical protein